MSEQPVPTVHNRQVTAAIASPRGIGAATGQGSDEDASSVSKGTDRGGN
jgi:hypothetical protein